MGGREEMTLVCSKCGSGNIVDDMDYGNRLAYKKCLMCGSIAIKEEIKIKEVTVDMMPKTIIPESGMYNRLENIRQQTGEKLVDFCGRIGISRSQWHRIRDPHPLGVTILARIADNLKINYDWLVTGTGIAPDRIDRIIPLPEPKEDVENSIGGKEVNEVKAVDSQQSTDDKIAVVGSNSATITEIQPVMNKYAKHAKCLVVGCDKYGVKDRYCTAHYKEMNPKAIPAAGKAVEVLEMYEMKENGRLATIGIKDGKYQHVYVEGINQHKWSYDDVMFLGEVAQEIKRLVEPSKAQRG